MLQDRVPSTVQDCRLFLSIGTFDPCFLQNIFTGVKVCCRDSAEIKNTLDVLKIHDLVALRIIFYLICVGENRVMTALAAGSS